MATIAPEIPSSEGGYVKLEKGENRFRILSEIIFGHEYWIEKDGKKSPVRKMALTDIDYANKPENEKVRYFWAFAIWKDNRVQVLEITQKTIQKAIASFINDEDYGDTTGYDIVVSREGDGLETEYTITPKPPKPLSDEASTAWAETLEVGFDLNQLFVNGDPFKPTNPLDKISTREEEVDISDIDFGE